MDYKSAARYGDIAIGNCRRHKNRSVVGMVIIGEKTVITENQPTATVGDVVLFECGHIGIIVSGSDNVTYVKDRILARYGSLVAGDVVGVIIQGAKNVVSF